MKALRSVFCTFALGAFLLLALGHSAATARASGGVAAFTGQGGMRHYFRNTSNGAQIAINKGFYIVINLTYDGEAIPAPNWTINQGPRRTTFGAATTGVHDWYQTMACRIDVYEEGTNRKIDTFNWSSKLVQPPTAVGFHYRCPEVPGNSAWPCDVALSFAYEKGTDPAASSVNVYVK